MQQGIGPLLVPYYRQLLPALRRVSNAERTNAALNDAIGHTLADLERFGGRFAFINIKVYMKLMMLAVTWPSFSTSSHTINRLFFELLMITVVGPDEAAARTDDNLQSMNKAAVAD